MPAMPSSLFKHCIVRVQVFDFQVAKFCTQKRLDIHVLDLGWAARAKRNLFRAVSVEQ